MRKAILLASAFGLSLTLGNAGAQEKSAAEAQHVMILPSSLQWMDTPPGIPAGCKMAVLHGDPSKEGPFAIRVKGPDGYKIPAHWHPTMEAVTVRSGIMYMGTGEKLDESKAGALPAGGFAAMPANVRHYVWFKGDTEIEIHANGPFAITYVNPADDPRNAKK